MIRRCLLCWASIVLLLAGCGGGRPPDEIEFWHVQSDKNALALEEIITLYNSRHPRMKVRSLYMGNYAGLYRKILSAIRADRLPELAVAYESMVSEYAKFGAVVALDGYLSDPVGGLSREDLADLFPVYLESNRFPQFGGKLLSFPFTKSVLMMYWNMDRVRDAGFDGPPQTWDAFASQCRAIRNRHGLVPYALSIDPSTLDCMIMGTGGPLLSPDMRRAPLDSPAAISVFRVLRDLVQNKLAYQVNVETYDDRNDFISQRAAFFCRSSTSRPYVEDLVGGQFKWDMALPPHGTGQPPMTVLFGANICVFKTTPERQRAAWDFIKFFALKEVTAKWATQTGYLPLRRSAAESARMKQLHAAHPAANRAFEALEYARSEPNVAGWQKVRDFLVKAEMDVVSGRIPPEDAARALAVSATACVTGSRELEKAPSVEALLLRAAMVLLLGAVFYRFVLRRA